MESLGSFLSSFRASSKAITIASSMPSRGVKTKVHSDGKEYVHKNSDSKIYQNYKLLEKFGVGVHIKGHTRDEVVMELITPLHKATKADIPNDAID